MRFTSILFLVVCLTGCSKPTPEEYFTMAQEAKRKAEEALAGPQHLQDSLNALAIQNYEMLVDDYPDHQLAETSLFSIAVVHNNGTHDYQKAIDAYARYVKTYAEGSQAPVAMFMIGYLYHNELHNLDSAAVAYERFLAKHPQHEMAMSAQFELSNLGKSPEEMISPQVAAEENKTAQAK